MPDVAQFQAALMARQGEHHNEVGCSSANFFKHNSLVFDGSVGPIATDNQIANFKDLAEALNCTDSQKVDYAGLKLDSEAKYWWKSINVTTHP